MPAHRNARRASAVSPSVLAASAMGLALWAAPAMAQDITPNPPASADAAGNPGAADNAERVNMVIIFGNDACPAPQDAGTITVCARKPEGERYRIPAPFRNTPSRQDESWTSRVTAYESVGATGTQSCSAVGAGGWTGCAAQLIHNAYAEKKASSDVQFSRMIEDAREKRLSTIDADAAKTQADVEKAEKDYDARQRAQQDAGADGASTADATPPPPK